MVIVTERAGTATTAEHRTHSPAAPAGPGRTQEPGGSVGGTDRAAVVIPAVGRITLVAMSADVVELARREIGCAIVERLRLGRALIESGSQMWVEENGGSAGRPPNPRASAVVLASSDPRLPLRGLFAGTAVFTGPDDPCGGHTLGLRVADALPLLRAATRQRDRRAAHRAHRGTS